MGMPLDRATPKAVLQVDIGRHAYQHGANLVLPVRQRPAGYLHRWSGWDERVARAWHSRLSVH